MAIATRTGEDVVVNRVVHDLEAQFGATVPTSRINDVVARARRDLDGQIVPGALEEMLHRLAEFRLAG